MFGISFNELLIILLLMVIFINPKDIPSVIKTIAQFIKKIKSFVYEIEHEIKNITNEIEETKETTYETFHDKIEKLRLDIEKESNLDTFDDEDKKTPKLNITNDE